MNETTPHTSAADREHLADLATRFTDAFNRDDLEAVMAFFTEDAIYDELTGRRSHGKAEIRAAFVPQFRGDFGVIWFKAEDLFVDPSTRQVMIRWLCTLEGPDGTRGWRGLDLLHFEGDLVKEKHTYAKAPAPLVKPLP